VQPDQASFFIMTPLPGSRDHQSMIEDGTPLDADYNRFDCVHETMAHPHMKDGAWTRAYAEAWRRFYSLENMKAILSRTRPEKYWDVFYNLLWYKHSIVNEGTHPMLAGFVRLKDRVSRRACFPQESRLAHLRRRIPEICALLRGTLRLTLEMEELWLATRKRNETEVPTRLSLFRERASLLRVSRLRHTRRDLARFWIAVRRQLRHDRIRTLLRVDRIALNALREIRVAAGFLTALMTGES
jgi:hypothetical protein